MANVRSAPKVEVTEKIPLCLAPFIGTFKSFNSTSPCCEIVGHAYRVSFDDYWNSRYTKSLRKAMWEHDYDNLPERCKLCLGSPTSHSEFFLLEDRKYFLESFLENKHMYREDGHMEGTPITYLALGISNECSMACRMCYPLTSSSRVKMIDKSLRGARVYADFENESNYDEGGVIVSDMDEALRLIRENKRTLREVVVHGGDPTFAKTTPAIMDALWEIRDTCKINYLSNGTFDKMRDGRNIFDLLAQFKDVNLVFSLDGIPEVNDYIRIGGRSKRCMSLIRQAQEKLPKNHYIGCHITVSNYSIYHFDKFLPWMKENLMDTGVWVSMNVVNNPPFYAPENLPDEIKRDIFMRLQPVVVDSPHLMDIKQEAIKSMFRSKMNKADFISALYLDTIVDKEIKVSNMLELFPLFEPYLENIENADVDMYRIAASDTINSSIVKEYDDSLAIPIKVEA